jgi:DNA-binding IclR family transcriptional regulator
MGLLNIIRRMHLRQKLSIREIARLTGVSRNTVTKHLAVDFHPELSRFFH